MTIPEKVQKVFAENPHIKVVVDGETRYYRGLKAYLQRAPNRIGASPSRELTA